MIDPKMTCFSNKQRDDLCSLLGGLWQSLCLRRRYQFGLLLLLMMFTSITEIISIGAVLPFLAILTSPEKLFLFPISFKLSQIFEVTNPNELLYPFTLFFCFAILASGAVRLALLWASSRFSFAVGADIGSDIYLRTLYQPYEVHCNRNSSEILSGITVKVDRVIFSVLVPLLTIVSSGTLFTLLLGGLFFIDPFGTSVISLSLGLIYFGIIFFVRKILFVDSKVIAKESTKILKSIQEGLGGIRDVLINGSQAAYYQVYREADKSYRLAQARSIFIGIGPRYLIETLGVILISFFAYFLTRTPDGISRVIPILGVVGLGAQRLLPVMQQSFGSWAQIQGSRASLKDVLVLLEQPLPNSSSIVGDSKLPFNNSISMRKISFRYNNHGPLIFEEIDLKIFKGSRIGFIGSTGSGKSTLLDVLMGLLQPTAGFIEVDDVPITPQNIYLWQAHIAHVPQAIFLSDSSIEENIAFGTPKNEINRQLVKDVAKRARIADVIEELPRKYDTLVGEQGIRLSGGQRQRIGIARALYKKADVIIFDEATSALDQETEQAVIEAIAGLDKDVTILMIAHRISSLRECDQIFELQKNTIRLLGSYEQLISG